MTHTGPMAESEGVFDKEKSCNDVICRKCGSKNITYRVWESSCGGYEDEKYTCKDCKHVWWIDGPDS